MLYVMLYCFECTSKHHVFCKKSGFHEKFYVSLHNGAAYQRCEAKVSNGLLDEAMTEIKELLPLLVESLGAARLFFSMDFCFQWSAGAMG